MTHRWASMATGATAALSVMWAVVVVAGHWSDAQAVEARNGQAYTVRPYSTEARHGLTLASTAAATELPPTARCRAGLAQAHLEMAVVAN